MAIVRRPDGEEFGEIDVFAYEIQQVQADQAW